MPAPRRGSEGSPLGAFIKAQRQMANLSLRQLSAMTAVSNAYLSQIERGLSEPSIRVLKAIAQALDLSADALLDQAGFSTEVGKSDDQATQSAIRADRRLTMSQRNALLTVYHTYLVANGYA
jgi:transcriptional regulator with XRE-family HTH domain